MSARNAGALDLMEETIAAGAPPPTLASGGWANWPGVRTSRHRAVDARDHARRGREGSALVAAGTLNDKLARQVLDGVLAGEGAPDEVVEARGLAVVSDDSARFHRSTRPSPRDVADKIRDGKICVGRDRRRGDEGHPRPGRRHRVRELVLERLA